MFLAIAAPKVGDLGNVLNVLSAMITPAVLIMACGSLILTTSSRLIRAVDRVRDAMPEMEKIEQFDDEKRAMTLDQLRRQTKRARFLQRALAQLYGALGVFVGTSVTIGVIALSGFAFAWIPLVLGFVGAGLLFNASILLIVESRIALAATFAEMDYYANVGRRYHKPREVAAERG